MLRPQDLVEDHRPLDVRIMPVHAAVYENRHFYTTGFVGQVLRALPQFFEEFMAPISLTSYETKCLPATRAMIARKAAVGSVGRITLQGDEQNEDWQSCSNIDIIVDASAPYLTLDYGVNAWLALDPCNTRNVRRTIHVDDELRYRPFSAEKLKTYALPNGEAPFWMMKNTEGEGGISLKYYFRTFAIAWNNLALQELGKNS